MTGLDPTVPVRKPPYFRDRPSPGKLIDNELNVTCAVCVLADATLGIDSWIDEPPWPNIDKLPLSSPELLFTPTRSLSFSLASTLIDDHQPCGLTGWATRIHNRADRTVGPYRPSLEGYLAEAAHTSHRNSAPQEHRRPPSYPLATPVPPRPPFCETLRAGAPTA